MTKKNLQQEDHKNIILQYNLIEAYAQMDKSKKKKYTEHLLHAFGISKKTLKRTLDGENGKAKASASSQKMPKNMINDYETAKRIITPKREFLKAFYAKKTEFCSIKKKESI